MSATCLQAFVSGRVQGVAFRWATRGKAAELGVTGWVRNLADGRVEAWFEGAPEAVSAMRAWLDRGPPGARVDGVECFEMQAAGSEGFEIRPKASV